MPLPEVAQRRSKLDPYMPFVLTQLEEYPTLHASRLWHMVRERGYDGSDSRVASARDRAHGATTASGRTLPAAVAVAR